MAVIRVPIDPDDPDPGFHLVAAAMAAYDAAHVDEATTMRLVLRDVTGHEHPMPAACLLCGYGEVDEGFEAFGQHDHAAWEAQPEPIKEDRLAAHLAEFSRRLEAAAEEHP